MSSAAGLLFALIPLGRAAQAAKPSDVGAIACSSQPSAVADFDKDKFDDIAVGVPGDTLPGKTQIDGSTTSPKPNAGSINVVYGGPKTSADAGGLQPDHGPTGAPKFVSEDTPGVAGGGARSGNGFGAAFAAGDFNHDGSPDLAVSAPNASGQAGAVHVFYGGGASRPGIRVGGNQVIQIGSRLRGTVVPGSRHPGDLLGWSLSTGDYNSDEFTDLAIGVPGYDVGGRDDAGAVLVVYGGPGGLSPAQSGTRPAAGLVTLAGKNVGGRTGDFFGASLASGNFNAQGADDLAIGSPGADVGRIIDAGAVAIVYGGSGGLALDHGPSKLVPFEGNRKSFRWFTENTPDVSDSRAASGDRFGCSLASGNFDGDASFDTDLAIGAPGRASGAEAPKAGAVTVLYNGGFGYGVTAQPPASVNCPAVSGTLPNCWTDPQVWTVDSVGVPDAAKKDDHFGASLYAGDLNGDDAADLVIGVPDETLFDEAGAGSIRVVFGLDEVGLTDQDTMAFAQAPPCDSTDNYTAVGMAIEEGDRFGASLAVGDFNGDAGHKPDIVVGVPGESIGSVYNFEDEENFGCPTVKIDDSDGAGAIQLVYDVTAVDKAGASAQSFDVLYRQQGGLRAQLDANGLGHPGLTPSDPGGSTRSIVGDHLGGALG